MSQATASRRVEAWPEPQRDLVHPEPQLQLVWSNLIYDHDGAEVDLKGEDKWSSRKAIVGNVEILFSFVADGHGGPGAAAYVSRRVVKYIVQAAAGDATAESLRRAGEQTFARLHDEVREMGMDDGTTLTLCMVNPRLNELTTLHVGDSTAILVPHADKSAPVPKPQRLTAEHRLEDSRKERARVVASGGNVSRLHHPVSKEPAGPLRAWPGGVACARAIGDADVGALISAVPASSTVPLKANVGGWTCVLASDGVWDALSHAAVVRLVRNAPRAPAKQLAAHIVAQAVNARHAFSNSGSRVPRDDTTCVVLRVAAPTDRDGSDGGRGLGCQMRCDSRCELPALVAEPIELEDTFVRDELLGATSATPLSTPSPADSFSADSFSQRRHPPPAAIDPTPPTGVAVPCPHVAAPCEPVAVS